MNTHLDVEKYKEEALKELRWELVEVYKKYNALGYDAVIIHPTFDNNGSIFNINEPHNNILIFYDGFNREDIVE